MAPGPHGRRRWRAIALTQAAGACLFGALLVRSGGSSGTDQPAATAPVASPTSPTAPPTDSEVDEVATPSEANASTAAVRVVAATQDWLYLSDEEVRAEVLAVATESAGPALADLTVEDVATARADLGLSAGPVWWVVHPLATRVAAFTPTAAEVEVWAVTVLAAVDVAAPQADWLTVTVDLAWSEGGWWVESIRDRPGPSPMLGARDQAWDAAPFTDALDGFDRLEGGPLDEAVGS